VERKLEEGWGGDFISFAWVLDKGELAEFIDLIEGLDIDHRY
jgi:hypothetical protein